METPQSCERFEMIYDEIGLQDDDFKTPNRREASSFPESSMMHAPN